MTIYTISSLKGGVGKTTLSIFLTQALRSLGLLVLAVDLDHNNNLTDYYFRNFDDEQIEGRNIRHALTGALKLEQVIHANDAIPATPTLATVGLELSRDPAGVLRLRSALRRLDYDAVVIDTPPALTLELTAGLYAADVVLVPVSASRWTVQGYQVIEAEVQRVGDSGLPVPAILAVPSMVTEAEGTVLQQADIWQATRCMIRRDPAIRSAATEGRELRIGTHGRNAFLELADELVGVRI
jgi:chromosome partitioning protein